MPGTPLQYFYAVRRGLQMSIEVRAGDGIADVIIDFPPVNALPAQGWHDLAAAIAAVGADPGPGS